MRPPKTSLHVLKEKASSNSLNSGYCIFLTTKFGIYIDIVSTNTEIYVVATYIRFQFCKVCLLSNIKQYPGLNILHAQLLPYITT